MDDQSAEERLREACSHVAGLLSPCPEAVPRGLSADVAAVCSSLVDMAAGELPARGVRHLALRVHLASVELAELAEGSADAGSPAGWRLLSTAAARLRDAAQASVTGLP